MSNNTTLPGTGEVVEDIDIGSGVKRQVVTLGDRAGSTDDVIGGKTETAPASDTASAGLNGRLQRIAQKIVSGTGSDGSGSITTGGTAQNLFGGSTPANGFEIVNPDPAEDFWMSYSTTAAPNGQGSIRIPANGGCYTSPPGMKPFAAVSLYGETTGHKFTAAQW